MCGIAGIVRFGGGGKPADPRHAVQMMNDLQKHRGPDANGIWSSVDQRCHFGHRRLSIIDLSVEANQPMTDRQGRHTIVFNGEIYNYKDLRAQLESKGHQFKTSSDTEVLLEGFADEGPRFFEKIDGMFAVAIYDSASGKLTLARDRAGEKPLYYLAEGGFLAFASELRALLSIPGQQYALSGKGVALYLALRYVPAPFTIIEGIQKVPPATIVEIDAKGQRTERRYFAFAANATPRPATDINACAEEVEDALEKSIRARLNSDVPLGAFLSSGIDSALVCAILTQRIGRPLSTFSVGFEDDPNSEHQAAAAIARRLGSEHHEFILGRADFDAVCENIGTLLDEPNGDRSCVPTYLLSREARSKVTVALSGDGGDELFAGYSRYVGFAQQFAKTPWKNAAEPAMAYFRHGLPVFPWEGIQEIVPASVDVLPAFAASFAPIFMVPGRTIVDALRMLDFDSYMPGAVLSKVDRMSMRHGLEVRTPFLYDPLYTISRGASQNVLFSEHGSKAVLRKLVGKYLTKTDATAPKKGFGMPGSVFLSNQQRVDRELALAIDVMRNTKFGAGGGMNTAGLAKWCKANINSAWATIVLAKWITSLNVSL